MKKFTPTPKCRRCELMDEQLKIQSKPTRCPERKLLVWGFIQRKKGFSILEIIVATFIFVMIMAATSAFFGKSMFSYRSAKALQKDLESAQFSMNLISKSLRTSTVILADDQQVKIFDYSQNKCIEYKFNDGNALKTATYDATYNTDPIDQGSNKTDCETRALSDFFAMTSGIVAGKFSVIPSSSSPSKTVGRVTIWMKVCPESGCSGIPKDEAIIQSTVSLRDYVEASL